MKFEWNWENTPGAYIPQRSTFKNVENQRFERLVAIYPVKRRNGIHWFCKCDCGNNTLVKTSRLGFTKSCGCLQKEHYKRFEKQRILTYQKEKKRIGEKQGQLIIIDVYKKEKNNRIGYLCKCTCGGTKCIDKKYFDQYKPQTCNSKADRRRRIIGSNNSNWRGCGEIPGRYLSAIKISAKNRNLIFNLKIEDLWEQYKLQNGMCAISGMQLDIDANASIDRIDSSKGYIKDNIQWVHKHINIMKNSQTMNQFLNICRIITEYNANK